MMTFTLHALAVFVAMFILDCAYAVYTTAVTKKRALAAANYGLVIIAIGSFSIIEYTSDHWLAVPAALGGWSGTFCTVAFSEKIKWL
jgi:hypothetical protein